MTVPSGSQPSDGSPSAGFLSTLREEFRCRNFGLSHPRPRALVSDEWGCPKFYAAWRIFWALYHMVWLIYYWVEDGLRTERHGVWLVYLTNQSFLVLSASTVIQAAVVLLVTAGRIDVNDTKTPWYLKLTWIVYEVSCTAAFLVTALYFGLLYAGYLSMLSTITHLTNAVYVLLDLCVTGTPVRLLHVIYVFIFGTWYLVFTVVYWAAGGVDAAGNPFIYSVLDWARPQTAAPLAVVTLVVGIPVLHLLLWLLHVVRRTVHGHMRMHSVQGRKGQDQNQKACPARPNESANSVN